MKKLLALLLAACMLLSVTAAIAEDAAATNDVPLVVAISTLSQKFSPRQKGNAELLCGAELRIVRMNGGGIDDTVRIGADIFSALADHDFGAERGEMICEGRCFCV